MKVLHYKLQKERKAVARLQEEKCGLQAQLLAGGTATPAQQQQQLSALLQELSAGRARIEGLLEDKVALAARLEALASDGDRSGRSATPEQRREATAVLAALQQQQEAAAAALREELSAEKARSLMLAQERGTLEGRLQEALGRLNAAEQISGHLEQVTSSVVVARPSRGLACCLYLSFLVSTCTAHASCLHRLVTSFAHCLSGWLISQVPARLPLPCDQPCLLHFTLAPLCR